MHETPRSQAEAACPPTPEQEQGPYYRDLRLDRRDIRERHPGMPLQLAIQVVDSDCSPLTGVVVEIWQCDALGVYSWYAAAGDDDEDGPAPLEAGTFLRGSQRLDENGRCRFETIYPGWYSGRTTHIHFKVHHGNDTLTGQLYFPDDLTDTVHQGPPYRDRPRRDTTNANDVIYADDGAATLLQPYAEGDGYVANVTLAVDLRHDAPIRSTHPTY
jgi:protocatechuate 3,4-dioxygenase beta subunit